MLGKIKAHLLEEVPYSLGLTGGREGAPPSNYFLPSPSLEPYDGKSEDLGPTPEVRKTAHAYLGETAECRGATPLNVGC